MKKIIFCAAIMLGAISIGKSQEIQILNYENNIVDYGTIKKGSDGKRVIKIKNIGDQPLVISNASASCGCTVPKWPVEPIAPGKKSEIEVVYNTGILGQFSKSVTITSNDVKDSYLSLRIKGEVVNNETTPVTKSSK